MRTAAWRSSKSRSHCFAAVSQHKTLNSAIAPLLALRQAACIPRKSAMLKRSKILVRSRRFLRREKQTPCAQSRCALRYTADDTERMLFQSECSIIHARARADDPKRRGKRKRGGRDKRTDEEEESRFANAQGNYLCERLRADCSSCFGSCRDRSGRSCRKSPHIAFSILGFWGSLICARYSGWSSSNIEL